MVEHPWFHPQYWKTKNKHKTAARDFLLKGKRQTSILWVEILKHSWKNKLGAGYVAQWYRACLVEFNLHHYPHQKNIYIHITPFKLMSFKNIRKARRLKQDQENRKGIRCYPWWSYKTNGLELLFWLTAALEEQKIKPWAFVQWVSLEEPVFKPKT